VASDTVVSSDPRYREIGASMRVLARREPTLATHVHIGIASPRAAVRLLNRLRVQLPLLLALSANSPFWQGSATGFASTRTTVFDAFPRTGVARAFRDYADWVERVDALLRSGAIADPSLLWWDARLQPRYGTVEVRIMDAQTTVADVAAVAALVQSLALLELERPDSPGDGSPANELIEENRFLAARDGMQALLIDVASGRRIAAIDQLEKILAACRPWAQVLGCGRELEAVRRLGAANGASRQVAQAHGGDLRAVTAGLAHAYAAGVPMNTDEGVDPVRRAA
jgi:glutamate---cysteine ligase / carboxylate-amine ligase